MTSLFRFLAGPMIAAAVFASPAAHAQGFSPEQRTEIEKIIRDYFVKHPEMIEELQQLAQAEKIKRAIAEHKNELFNSPRQVTLGNPDGDVTMVEFFDYNCGYCKRAMADMIALLEEDARLKIVLKEYPVLGPASVEAARVAIAVRMQDADGGKYLAFHKALLGSRGRADAGSAMAAAREAGLDMDRLARDVDSDEVRQSIEESRSLARAIGVTGTPAYVIGNTLVPGAVGVSALRSHIAAVRASRQSAN